MSDDLVERVATVIVDGIWEGNWEGKLSIYAARKIARAIIPIIQADEREECAKVGYRICAETRHVTLGDKVATAIRERSGHD